MHRARRLCWQACAPATAYPRLASRHVAHTHAQPCVCLHSCQAGLLFHLHTTRVQLWVHFSSELRQPVGACCRRGRCHAYAAALLEGHMRGVESAVYTHWDVMAGFRIRQGLGSGGKEVA